MLVRTDIRSLNLKTKCFIQFPQLPLSISGLYACYSFPVGHILLKAVLVLFTAMHTCKEVRYLCTYTVVTPHKIAAAQSLQTTSCKTLA